MFKCFNDTFGKLFGCLRKTFSNDYNKMESEDERAPLKNDSKKNKMKIFQISSSNTFVPQGDYTKMENYDIFYRFLNKPLVKIYIEQIFRPNKEIQAFQHKKVNGIYDQIKDVLDALLKRLNIELIVPEKKYCINTAKYYINTNPATKMDLDLYTPLFMMEWWIYGRSFIEKAKLKQIYFVHDITVSNMMYDQERTGLPDYEGTKSIILSAKERNFAYIRIVLHHEFFHYIDIADDNTYEDNEFEKLNEDGFEYGNGGDTERNWIKLDKDINGFINHYSMSALEEDKAEIYHYLIGCPDEALNNRDIIVRKKAKRIQDFLNNFDKNGMGNYANNFWANLIDFRKKFVYREQVFQGNISH